MSSLLNIYEILYHRILDIPSLLKDAAKTHDGKVVPALYHPRFDGARPVSFSNTDIDAIVNDLDSSKNYIAANFRCLREACLIPGLGGTNKKVIVGPPKNVYNAAEKEIYLHNEYISKILNHWSNKKVPPHLAQELKNLGLSIPNIRNTLDDMLEKKGRPKKKKDTAFVESLKQIDMDGIIQLISYNGNKGKINFSDSILPPELQTIAVTGRPKAFASASEKVIRNIAEHCVMHDFYSPSDYKKIKNAEDYSIKNDLIALRVIFPSLIVFQDSDNIDAVRKSLLNYKRCCNIGSLDILKEYRKDGLRVKKTDEQDVVYFDAVCKDNHNFDAEIQVTDWLHYTLTDVIGERSHLRYKTELKKKGVPDSFFEKPEIKKSLSEQQKKGMSKTTFENNVRTRYINVYNFLLDRFYSFIDAVNSSRENMTYPPHLQFDRNFYLRHLG